MRYISIVSNIYYPFLSLSKPSLKDLSPLPNSDITLGSFPAPNNIKTISTINKSSPNLPNILLAKKNYVGTIILIKQNLSS